MENNEKNSNNGNSSKQNGWIYIFQIARQGLYSRLNNAQLQNGGLAKDEDVFKEKCMFTTKMQGYFYHLGEKAKYVSEFFLYEAIRCHDFNMVDVIIKCGTDVNAQKYHEKTAFEETCIAYAGLIGRNKHARANLKKIAILLAKRGVDITTEKGKKYIDYFDKRTSQQIEKAAQEYKERNKMHKRESTSSCRYTFTIARTIAEDKKRRQR